MSKFQKDQTVLYRPGSYRPFKKFPFGLFTISNIRESYRSFQYYDGKLVNKEGEWIYVAAMDERNLVKLDLNAQ